MYQVRLVQKAQRIKQLLRKNAHKSCTQASELILLDQLVKVHAE
jgi:hypothetical protein